MTDKEINELEQQQRVTFSEVVERAEEMATETHAKYADELLAARKIMARQQLTQYLNAHPKATTEETLAFMKDYIEQTPTELERNMRIFVNTFGTLFNLQNQMLNEIYDFKQLYIAANRQKLEVAAHKIIKEQARVEEETTLLQ